MSQSQKFTEREREEQAIGAIESATREIRALFDSILPDGLPQATLTAADVIVSDLEEAAQRVADGRILVAIVGGRGGGKSSFINAILGYNLLPEGPVEACTTFPAVVSFSREHELKVTSEIPQHAIHLEGLDPSELKGHLRNLLDEEYNRDNIKCLKGVTVGVPANILRRIDLADVPGFTLGNKRQQLLAERYSTQKADLALVLLNNSDSVEIRGSGGLDGLADCFQNRLRSTIFIVNKADEDPSLEYFEKLRRRFVQKLQNRGANASEARIYAVFARAILDNSQAKYEFDQILRDFVVISGQSRVFAAAGSFERVADSLSALGVLCRKDREVLLKLRERLVQLSQVELPAHAKEIQESLLYEGVVKAQQPPKIEPRDLALPFPNPSELAAIYMNRLFQHIQEYGTQVVNKKGNYSGSRFR